MADMLTSWSRTRGEGRGCPCQCWSFTVTGDISQSCIGFMCFMHIMVCKHYKSDALKWQNIGCPPPEQLWYFTTSRLISYKNSLLINTEKKSLLWPGGMQKALQKLVVLWSNWKCNQVCFRWRERGISFRKKKPYGNIKKKNQTVSTNGRNSRNVLCFSKNGRYNTVLEVKYHTCHQMSVHIFTCAMHLFFFFAFV